MTNGQALDQPVGQLIQRGAPQDAEDQQSQLIPCFRGVHVNGAEGGLYARVVRARDIGSGCNDSLGVRWWRRRWRGIVHDPGLSAAGQGL